MTQINVVQILYNKKTSIISKLKDMTVYVCAGIFGLFHGRHFKRSFLRVLLLNMGGNIFLFELIWKI